ncbi:hypothetical protein ABZ626_16730 [Streptomyces longispororuber]|uniref:hypothetical protein n=1 Tax=Streptomyces longispororuber TaxID=68230 RepID=UPI0033D1873B
MRKVTAGIALGLSAVLLSGCGGSDSKDDEAKKSATQSSRKPQQEERKSAARETTGMDGTWKPINKSPIVTMTITGNKVTTTGKLTCPGTLKPSKNKKGTVITLNCQTKDPDRSRGTLEFEDGTHVIISWDGPPWGGLIDSFIRA